MADADAQSLDAAILTHDAALLKDTVRDAGVLAQSMFRTELRKWTKGASSPVSEADIAVNDLLEARLRAATPDYGWLSEESADDAARLSRRLTWIVDPIDGTRNYLGGHDDWCISVALVEDASPVLAAVFAPTRDEFFFAARGQGTTLNGAAVRASPGSVLDFTRIAGPKPMVERLNGSGGEIELHPRIGSLALRLCRVAHGALDAAFAGGNSHDWDLAAADLIVQEADGRMSDLSGDPILYNRREVAHGVLVAAGRDRHAGIVAHFRNRPFA
ncbi:3'(2'),5'-bisphosphate nucleotidase CysQ [Bradyrhizobium sp. CCGB12]|uniref:3'(2'),5'-bisphosphate nucleotidase CysQ n=1 Tax=Bradyrhizobium sp. CCGB12 TaxID=2949632 RepID=UPI0020B2690B|nr:3'(2'),5'-bisphosphate nucleotidase CysQ [Bradyrhizobium sp. CCGB12]MCP3394587.1 3'(2'),5'-bisphosphate nucleotidase CysQ [Bradyrhizobium sp. CCGB12]